MTQREYKTLLRAQPKDDSPAELDNLDSLRLEEHDPGSVSEGEGLANAIRRRNLPDTLNLNNNTHHGTSNV